MSWVAVGVGAAGLISGGIAASGAKSSAAKAADLNAQNTANTNALNERLFNQSRGAADSSGYGHSILPVYFGGNEEDLAKQAYSNFSRLNGLGENAFTRLQGYQSSLRPAAQQSISALSDRFNGNDLAQRTAYANPYFQSRLNQAGTYGQGLRDVASANNSAINTGLQQYLGQLQAQRASQGFLGGSTFDRNRALASTIAARQAAAIGTAQANSSANNYFSDAQFANAGDLRGLQMSDLDFRSRPDALGAGLNALSGFESGPAQALSNYYTSAQQPLNFFRVSPQAFQAQNQPMQEPNINNSQILGSAIQQGAGAYANYQFGQQLSNRYGAQAQRPPSYSNVAAQYPFNNSYSGQGNYNLAPQQEQAPSSYFNYQYTPPY